MKYKIMILTILAVFIGGISYGGELFTWEDDEGQLNITSQRPGDGTKILDITQVNTRTPEEMLEQRRIILERVRKEQVRRDQERKESKKQAVENIEKDKKITALQEKEEARQKDLKEKRAKKKRRRRKKRLRIAIP